MKKIIAYGLIGLGILIVVHHWYTNGYPADVSHVLCHEFILALIIGLLIGGVWLGH